MIWECFIRWEIFKIPVLRLFLVLWSKISKVWRHDIHVLMLSIGQWLTFCVWTIFAVVSSPLFLFLQIVKKKAWVAASCYVSLRLFSCTFVPRDSSTSRFRNSQSVAIPLWTISPITTIYQHLVLNVLLTLSSPVESFLVWGFLCRCARNRTQSFVFTRGEPSYRLCASSRKLALWITRKEKSLGLLAHLETPSHH